MKTKILIVEDEPAMVAGLRDNFEYEGYDVISAEDGVSGLDRALSDNPDLVVLDVMMPRLDGLAVLRELRNDERLARSRVIVLTAQPMTRDEAIDLGADRVLDKPFAPDELAAAVKEVLAEQR
jgi:two-component system alkaline phosphatase synthesis response regulator PhoP